MWRCVSNIGLLNIRNSDPSLTPCPPAAGRGVTNASSSWVVFFAFGTRHGVHGDELAAARSFLFQSVKILAQGGRTDLESSWNDVEDGVAVSPAAAEAAELRERARQDERTRSSAVARMG
eukprot:Polyplicarium_translucidae@DN5544_c0_g1_i1.p2